MPKATIALVPTYIANAPMAVKDTSMPPEASTSRTPTANIAVTMPLRSRSKSVDSDRKLGSTQAVKTQKPTKNQAHQGLVAGEEAIHRTRSVCEPRCHGALVHRDARDLLGHAARLHDQDAVAGSKQLGNII